MDNGCKFSESKSVEVFLSVKNSRIEIEFIDKGIGIDSADLDKIFHPFYRASAAKNIAGNGLGLALSSKIISLHRGAISVQSQPGIGTNVTVGIPVFSGI
jgi:signal transduction histidine kinase